MDQSRGLSVLVVDNDERSLVILVEILVGWKYQVLTANSAHDALETLREFGGFLNLIITEFHIPGMDGFEFHKCVKDKFKLPIIMMSNDNRKDVISKCLENGVALYVLKPFVANDFKDIWKYAATSSNENVNLLTPNESEGSRKYCKRKSLADQDNNEGKSFHILKKPIVKWDINLHKLFLNAINQIGVEKAVPKRILEIMNLPHLTRKNVASHLQKYRLFLKKVEEKENGKGLSHRSLRSKFATSLPISTIHDMQEKYEKQRDSAQHKRFCYTNPYNNVVTCLLDKKVAANNSYATTQHGKSQFPYSSTLSNQLQDRKIDNNIYNNMLKRSENLPYGVGHGLMASQNYGSMENHNPSLVSSLINENFDVLQQGFGVSSEVTEIAQQKLDDNVVRNEQQFISASSNSEAEFNPLEENPFENFCMLDNIDLFDDVIDENNRITSEFSNVDEFSNSSEQPRDQLQGSDTFLKGGLEEKFTRNISGSSNTSSIEWEIDMDKIEALFGTNDD